VRPEIGSERSFICAYPSKDRGNTACREDKGILKPTEYYLYEFERPRKMGWNKGKSRRVPHPPSSDSGLHIKGLQSKKGKEGVNSDEERGKRRVFLSEEKVSVEDFNSKYLL